MSEPLLNYLNNEVKLSKKITNLSEDFCNGYYFAEILQKNNIIKNMKEYSNVNINNNNNDFKNIIKIENNFKKLQKILEEKLNINLNNEDIENVKNKNMQTISNIIFKIKINIDRKKINFNEILDKITEHNENEKKENDFRIKTYEKIYHKKYTEPINKKLIKRGSVVDIEKNKIILQPIKKKPKKFKYSLKLNTIEEELLSKKFRKTSVLALTSTQINNDDNNNSNDNYLDSKFNTENYCSYISLNKNLYKLGLNINNLEGNSTKKEKLKKYGEGLNNNFIPTNIIIKKINNNLPKKIVIDKDVINKNENILLTETKKVLKYSLINRHKLKEELFNNKKNSKLNIMRMYDKNLDKTIKTAQRSFNTEFLQTDYNNFNNSNNFNYYKTDHNFNIFNKRNFFKTLNNEKLVDRKIKLIKKYDKKTKDTILIKNMLNKILDIVEECHFYQIENEVDLINIPEWKNWMSSFIYNTDLQSTRFKSKVLDFLKENDENNNNNKLDEKIINFINKNKEIDCEFYDYINFKGFFEDDNNKNNNKNKYLHIYDVLGNEINRILSSKNLIYGLKPREMKKMKNEDFELEEWELNNLKLTNENEKNSLFTEILEMNIDNSNIDEIINNISKLENKKANEDDEDENSKSFLSQTENNENNNNNNSNLDNNEKDSEKNENNSNKENENEEKDNFNYNNIPIRICLLGHSFSGKKTHSKLLTEKYPNIKIYTFSNILKDLKEEYNKIYIPFEENPLFKNVKKNQIKNLQKEIENSKINFDKYFKHFIEPLMKNNNDNNNDNNDNENKKENENKGKIFI